MKSKYDTPNPELLTPYQNLQEIISVCMSCGSQNRTGKYTRMIDPENQYAYSHGYCEPCGQQVYSELEAELVLKIS